MLVIDQSYAGRQVELPVGQVMELRLEENRTTGYGWTIISDGRPACAVTGDSYAAPPGPPGRGGVHAWEIRGVQPGMCDITLQYRRPWETNAPPAQSFTVRVRVG